jgi:hypothetical protein
MAKKWIILNLALLALAGLLAWQLQVSVERFRGENDLGKLQSSSTLKKRVAPVDAGLTPLTARRTYNPADFGVIPAQNLFSDLRGKPEEETKPAVTEAPALAVKPILIGISVSGNQRLASIIDPSAGQQGRRAQTRRVGDIYQGYTITDIGDSRIVLENGNRREIIPIFDTTKERKGASRTPILATRVVNFGGGGAAGGTPTAAPVNAAAAARPASGGQSQPAAATPPAPASVNQQPSVRTTIPPPQRQVPSNSPNERTDDQGRRIIRTPFGDIVRDKPPND